METLVKDFVQECLTAYNSASYHFQREVSFFMTPEHGAISITSKDCAGEVDFDWDGIWDHIRSSGIKPSRAIMLHSHPTGHAVASSTDDNMVRGWRLALGVPVDFFITTQFPKADKITNVLSYYVCDRFENGIDLQFPCRYFWEGIFTSESDFIVHNYHSDITFSINESVKSAEAIMKIAEVIYGASKLDRLTDENKKEILRVLSATKYPDKPYDFMEKQ